MRLRKRRTYHAYADIYDRFKGDRSSSVELILSLIGKYKHDAHSVLDLACGTGSIARALVDHFAVFGLDNSISMLRIARQKVPAAHFVRGDMESFKLGMSFDVIYCLHNSANHLLSFQQWENMFSAVAHHLVTGGIFIFDFNPVDKMDRLTTVGPCTTSVGDDYVITQVIKEEAAGHYIWDTKILLKKKGRHILYDEPVKVSSYPEHKIAEALRAKFKIAEHFELENPATPDDVGRVYYVCVKT